jgi:hypothetical protein
VVYRTLQTIVSELPLNLPPKDVPETQSNSEKVSIEIEISIYRIKVLIFFSSCGRTRGQPMENTCSRINGRKKKNCHVTSMNLGKCFYPPALEIPSYTLKW